MIFFLKLGVRKLQMQSNLTSVLLSSNQFIVVKKKYFTLFSYLTRVEQDFDTKGLDVLSPRVLLGSYSRPRLQEIAAAINRLRALAMK